MTATAKKRKPTVVEAAPIPPERAALAAAIAAAAEAQRKVAAKQATIEASYGDDDVLEKRLEAARKAVAAGREADAKQFASNLERGASPASPWHEERALTAVQHAEQAIEGVERGQKQLRQQLVELQDDASDASNNVLVEIRKLVLPRVQELLGETATLRERLSVNHRLLDILTSTEHRNDQPTFANSLRGTRATERRATVLGGLRAEAQRLAYGNDDAAELAAIRAALAAWKAALAALRSDASAELPKV